MCIQLFLHAALEGDDIKITGDGKQSRNFIHIDDLVRGLVLITEKGIAGETINLAGNEKISVNDIARYAQEFGARDAIYTENRKDDFFDQDVSIAKAERLLGWKPEITFDQGMRKFFEWLTN